MMVTANINTMLIDATGEKLPHLLAKQSDFTCWEMKGCCFREVRMAGARALNYPCARQRSFTELGVVSKSMR